MHVVSWPAGSVVIGCPSGNCLTVASLSDILQAPREISPEYLSIELDESVHCCTRDQETASKMRMRRSCLRTRASTGAAVSEHGPQGDAPAPQLKWHNCQATSVRAASAQPNFCARCPGGMVRLCVYASTSCTSQSLFCPSAQAQRWQESFRAPGGCLGA